VVLAAVIGVMGGLAGLASAQPQLGNLLPQPRLLTITPMGAKQGTTVELSFSGTDLDLPEELLFSHPGIKAVAVIPPPPKVDPKAKPDPKKPAPGPAPVTKFTVTVANDVPLGSYDVRLVNKHGVSNPRMFLVGNLAETMEKEPNNDVDQAQPIDIGQTINGAVNAPVDVDYFLFTGKKGQRVVVSCLTATIDSRMNPEIRLLHKVNATTERELASQRPAPLTDGVLDYLLPADGDYLVRVNQFTYTAGSAEYFYRLTVSTGPWIDAVFPPMVEPGKTSQVTVYGRNLPGGKIDPQALLHGRPLERITVTVNAPKDPQALSRLGYTGHASPITGLLDGFEYRITGPGGFSNPFLITFAQAPVVVENDANDTLDTAQEIAVPGEIAGRINKKRDRDWYAFTAKKGDVYMIEVLSHRLGAQTDMYFSLRNVDPKQEIVQLDDTPETLSPKGFYTVHRDPPAYRFVVPADGKYRLLVANHLGDTQADATHVYRVRIAPEKPDFRLVVMPPDDFRPDACSLGQGGSQNYLVFVHRVDGFKGQIALSMEGLPMGVTCKPQVLGPGLKQALLVVTAADNVPKWTGEVKVTGTATINGQSVTRQARPASITWPVQAQQNVPTITRLDRQLMLAVRDKSQAPFHIVAGTEKVTVVHGDKVNIPIKVIRHLPDFKAQLQIQVIPNELPPNVTFGNLTLTPGKDEQPLVLAVAASVPPGDYNLVFRGFGPASPNPKGKPVNVVLPSTPVQLTVLPKQVATLSVNNANPNVKLGTQSEIVVKVARMYDFDGPFKVKLVLPAGVKDVSADEVTIPAGQNEAKLIVRVLDKAPAGNRQNISIQAVAVVNGNVPLTHETKINVNVVK
jgi:hypothetical protein